MKRFLWKCLHEWQQYEKYTMTRTHAVNPNLGREYIVYVLKCKNCGDLKEKIIG